MAKSKTEEAPAGGVKFDTPPCPAPEPGPCPPGVVEVYEYEEEFVTAADKLAALNRRGACGWEMVRMDPGRRTHKPAMGVPAKVVAGFDVLFRRARAAGCSDG